MVSPFHNVPLCKEKDKNKLLDDYSSCLLFGMVNRQWWMATTSEACAVKVSFLHLSHVNIPSCRTCHPQQCPTVSLCPLPYFGWKSSCTVWIRAQSRRSGMAALWKAAQPPLFPLSQASGSCRRVCPLWQPNMSLKMLSQYFEFNLLFTKKLPKTNVSLISLSKQ